MNVEIAIVGAGFSGLGAAIKLKQAGFDDFVILDQSGDVGGTWRDNTYPGVAVDITSFNYSFSFEQNPDWSRVYAPGRELKAYADHLVDKYDLRKHLRLGTRIVGATFDERRHLWRAETADGATVTSRFAVGATGGLTQPKAPDIPGLADFAGKTMHTARWDHDYDLRGKRVAVIGTGATAVQLVPSIADEVERLHVFQRTPIWVVPKIDFGIHPAARRLFRALPLTQSTLRASTGVITEAVMVMAFLYQQQMPALQRGIERLCKAHLRRQVRDPELRAKLTPQYAFGCKRPTFSNDYLRSFTRDDVELVTDGIERITPEGIRTADGRLREVDVLVLATGFKVFELGNTPAFPIHGVGGVELGQFWHEHRYQSYEGVSMPRFPNLFPILAPYSLTGPSYFSMIEASMTHTLRCLQEARRRGATYVEVRQEPHDTYFADILRRQERTVFKGGGCGGSNSYYFDRHGDAPMLRPAIGPEMWWRARHFDLNHYEFRTLDRTPLRALEGARS